MSDLTRCVMHAEYDTIHKLAYQEWDDPPRRFLDSTRTECGALTSNMSRITEWQVKEAPTSVRCKRCFSSTEQAKD